MTKQAVITATLKQEPFEAHGLRGRDHRGAFYRITLGDMPVILFLPHTGFHISAVALAWLREEPPQNPHALAICEALLAQDCEPVSIVEVLA